MRQSAGHERRGLDNKECHADPTSFVVVALMFFLRLVSGKGSYSQAPSLWPRFFLAVPRGRLAVATGWGHFKSNELSCMPGVRSAALQHGSTSGSAPTGLGEKQAWKDVLVGREVLRGPVAQGDRVGRNADEECTGCPGNGAGTEVSHCGCSGKDKSVG